MRDNCTSFTLLDGSPQPEWLRVPAAVLQFGLSRTKLYQLAKAGRIRSVSLRDEGQSKGTRLFCVKSLRDYIESFEGKGEAN